MKNIITTIIVAVLVSVLSVFIINKIGNGNTKIAYVDSSKLMVGFSEASRVNNELKAEDDKWKKELKVMEDSLSQFIKLMSKEYDKSSASKKKELQDMLAAKNKQLNNYKEVNIRKMEKLNREKMSAVMDKINVYLEEFGKSNSYDIIFGTAAGGSILYGNKSKFDITSDLIKGLNERYQ